MGPPRGPLRSVESWERRYGAPAPLGATFLEEEDAYNFALYSKHATSVTLLAYRKDDPVTPVMERRLLHPQNRTGMTWHCFIPAAEMRGACHYAYRVDGPRGNGHRHDPGKVLLDPFAPAVHFPPGYSREACARPGPTDGVAPLGVLPGPEAPFDWGEDPRPRHNHDAVIYELHVKGFTARANSGVAPGRRGTFAGLVDKIPHLKELGVTIVELLPVHQFDPQEGNYWGYMTLHFFSPHQDYASGEAFGEFRAMVRAMHEAGIQVWLDVVYNHTSEGDDNGPTQSLRGIDNRSYYLMRGGGDAYVNDTGCGNTLRCGHLAARALVLRSVHFWATRMHVDGFRFDLASILSRASDGTMGVHEAPMIPELGFLAQANDVRLVAEAWDIASYQLGQGFPGVMWMQWNGKFRDDARSFVAGAPGLVPALMRRLYGSDDLFPDEMPATRRPYQSINFVTAHDGFCLHDLVAYNGKHNEANGHGNTDGSDDNRSWNCGWEGEEGAPPEVLALRRQQARNLCAILMLSNGVPMLVAGDEFLNTQHGNNNPYNQDNETTWLDWDRLEQNRDTFRFFQLMIAFRKAHPSIARGVFWREDVAWHGVGPDVDMGEHSRALACFLRGEALGDDDLYVMINGWSEDLGFTVQQGAPGEWLRVADTSLPSPRDIVAPGQEEALESLACTVRARSVVLLRRPRRRAGGC